MHASQAHPVEQLGSETLEIAHRDFQQHINTIGIDTLLATLPNGSEIGVAKYADERIDCIVVPESTLQRLARRSGLKPNVRHSLFAHYEGVIDMAGYLPSNQSVLVVDKQIVDGYDE